MLYNKITILLTLIYFLVRFDISDSQKVCFNNELITVTKRGLNNTQFWSAKVQDFEQCAKLCIRRKLCQSINYDSQTQSCELNSGLRTPETTKKGDNLVYSEFSWWPANVLDKHCYTRPCSESEICIPGSLTGTSSGCSFSCMKAISDVCPFPSFGVSNGRTVGSVNIYSCPKGSVGGGSAKCLENKQWDKEIDTTCNPILGAKCQNNELCTGINGICSQDGQCECGSSLTYNRTKNECESQSDCGEPPVVPGATVTESGEIRQYTCNTPVYYPLPTSGNGTISCDKTTSRWVPEGFKCGGLHLVPKWVVGDIKEPPMSGYLQMFFDGIWKTITYDGWTWKETQVACRKMFGLEYGGTFYEHWYGITKQTILTKLVSLSEITCAGNEDLLETCPNFIIEAGEVGHDIALTCFRQNITGARNVQLSNENKLQGTVNITFNGTIGGLCGHDWTLTETKVACRTIGSSFIRKDECTQQCPESKIAHIHANHISCNGDEPHLFYCRNQGWGYVDCTTEDLVYITCTTP